MNPILKYPGAKWRLADWIISHMPPHVGYVEPFFGSGGVFFNKAPSVLETINDLDGAVVRFFKTCRDQPDTLARAIGLTPWSRKEFLLCDFGEGNPDDVEAARQFAVRCWMTFGARTRCKTGWRHSTGTKTNYGPNNPAIWAKLPEIVAQVGERLLQAQIENKAAVQVIKENNGYKVLVYADPPYLKETRTLHGDQYRCEMTDAEHEDLLNTLLQHRGMVLLSGYDNTMYRDLLQGWHIESMDTNAERGATRKEFLWINPMAMERNGQMRMEI